MRWFLVMYFAVYGGMHAYLLWKVHAAWPRLGAWLCLPGAWLAAMVLAPILLHAFRAAGHLAAARATAWAGYLWMAAILWFLFLALGADLWNLGVRLAALKAPGAARLLIAPRALLAASAAAVLALGVWGRIEAGRVRVRHLAIRTPRLAAGEEPLRVVQVSDLHLDVRACPDALRDVAGRIAELRPDLLVCTGDLADEAGERMKEVLAPLAAIEPPLGKLAVLGNHEFYVGAEKAVPLLESAGFRVLRGESVLLGNRLRVAGVDDPAAAHVGADASLDEYAALPSAKREEFVLLLKHQPTVRPGSAGRFDLQLSGHTHGGQIFPFWLLVRIRYRRTAGAYDLGDGARLYVSRGTGTWGPRLRVLAPPEITLITIEPAE